MCGRPLIGLSVWLIGRRGSDGSTNPAPDLIILKQRTVDNSTVRCFHVYSAYERKDRKPDSPRSSLRFDSAVCKVVTLTPEEQAEVERKVKEEEKKLMRVERNKQAKANNQR